MNISGNVIKRILWAYITINSRSSLDYIAILSTLQENSVTGLDENGQISISGYTCPVYLLEYFGCSSPTDHRPSGSELLLGSLGVQTVYQYRGITPRYRTSPTELGGSALLQLRTGKVWPRAALYSGSVSQWRGGGGRWRDADTIKA